MFENLSRGHRIASPAATIAIVCFFFPWILVSCGNQPALSLSGWQLAAGFTLNLGFYAERIPGEGILFVVLIAGLAVLAMTYLALRRRTATKLESYSLVGLGALPLVVLLLELVGRSDTIQVGVTVKPQVGLWGLVLGYIAVIIGGVLNLAQPGAQSVPPPRPTLEPAAQPSSADAVDAPTPPRAQPPPETQNEGPVFTFEPLDIPDEGKPKS